MLSSLEKFGLKDLAAANTDTDAIGNILLAYLRCFLYSMRHHLLDANSTMYTYFIYAAFCSRRCHRAEKNANDRYKRAKKLLVDDEDEDDDDDENSSVDIKIAAPKVASRRRKTSKPDDSDDASDERTSKRRKYSKKAIKSKPTKRNRLDASDDLTNN